MVKKLLKEKFTNLNNNKFALMLNMLHCMLTYLLYRVEYKTSPCCCQHLLKAPREKDEMWLLDDYLVV